MSPKKAIKKVLPKEYLLIYLCHYLARMTTERYGASPSLSVETA